MGHTAGPGSSAAVQSHDSDTPRTGAHAVRVWLGLLAEVGFQPEQIHDAFGRDLFLGRRPPG